MFKYIYVIIFIIFCCGVSVICKSVRKPCTSLSSCEARFCTTNKFTKKIQQLHHTLLDLSHIDLSHPKKWYNYNNSCVEWSKYLSTKGMKHLSLWDNYIIEFVHTHKLEVCHISGKMNEAKIFIKELCNGYQFRALINAFMWPIPW